MRIRLVTQKNDAPLTSISELFEGYSSFAVPVAEDNQFERTFGSCIKQFSKCMQDDIEPFLVAEVTTRADDDVCRKEAELLSNGGSGGRARTKSLDIRTIPDTDDPSRANTIAKDVVLSALLRYRDYRPGPGAGKPVP
jgi:hypothetical protein